MCMSAETGHLIAKGGFEICCEQSMSCVIVSVQLVVASTSSQDLLHLVSKCDLCSKSSHLKWCTNALGRSDCHVRVKRYKNTTAVSPSPDRMLILNDSAKHWITFNESIFAFLYASTSALSVEVDCSFLILETDRAVSVESKWTLV